MKKILCLLLFTPFLLKGQIITTFAGNGTSGYTGDGGTATAAAISVPGGITFDRSGNVYFSAYSNHTIRKISTSGIITTIAGTGIPGYSGDGGAATSAQLSSPIKIAMDGMNNLYIADELNNRVRKINSAGIITTLAGTGIGGYNGDGIAATLAKLFHPTGVCVDRMGNVYIADDANYLVRKVSTSGIISTVAGTGIPGNTGDGGPATAARLNQPYGVSIDSFDNIYISDQQNNKIRKVSSTGIITTFAGTGASGFSGDGGPATAAVLSNPSAVAFDSSGNVYIIDQLNNRVRMVNTSGIINTIAGSGTAGYIGDGMAATASRINQSNDIGIDHSSRLYICDNLNFRIRAMGNCTGSVTAHPVHDTVFEGIDAKYNVTTSMPSPSYQWQEDPGSGFVNLANVWPYSGVFTDTLTIDYTSIFLHATHYRCIVTNGFCADTSNAAILIVRTTTNLQSLSSTLINIYPNPAHDQLHIKIADQTCAVNIQLMNELGQVLFEQNTVTGSTNLNIADLPPAMYIIRLQSSGQTVYKRFLKN